MILSPPIYPIHPYILYIPNHSKSIQITSNNFKSNQIESNLLFIVAYSNACNCYVHQSLPRYRILVPLFPPNPRFLRISISHKVDFSRQTILYDSIISYLSNTILHTISYQQYYYIPNHVKFIIIIV